MSISAAAPGYVDVSHAGDQAGGVHSRRSFPMLVPPIAANSIRRIQLRGAYDVSGAAPRASPDI
jgi:hypothetical protein